MEQAGGGISQEALERLQSIIKSLQTEKDSLASRLQKANLKRIVVKPSDDTQMVDSDSTQHENYIFLKETGLVFSSSVLSYRLRQPPSTKPVPFSQVYVCDFELDFVSKDNTDTLITPIRDLKSKVRELQED